MTLPEEEKPAKDINRWVLTNDGSMNAAGTAPDVICVKSEDSLDRCLELIREDCLH